MVFHSLDFLAFLAVLLGCYWLVPFRAQNSLLLVGSLFFYGYVHPWFVGLLLISASTDYLAALLMTWDPTRKRRYLWVSIAANFGILGFFKYFGFFVANTNVVLERLGLGAFAGVAGVVLPAGISFYTFQSVSYTIDVYRGQIAARRRLDDFILFVTFFPQLVAGPIERAGRLLSQIERPRRFDPELARSGIAKIVWGFFKKMVIADNVAMIVQKVFSLDDPPFPVLWAGVFAFCIQIYADFSAYTDIARGSARLFGFELSENFRHPYLSRSPEEFWRRWHISLSTWFRDYLYIPLGGARVSPPRWALNILLVFGASGLWHGASWNFVLWGLYWGALVLIYRFAHRLVAPRVREHPLLAPLQILVLFVLTNIGWLMFREQDLGYLVRALTTSPMVVAEQDWRIGAYLGFEVLLLSVPLWLHAAYDRLAFVRAASGEGLLTRVVVTTALFVGILSLRADVGTPFIYFQF